MCVNTKNAKKFFRKLPFVHEVLSKRLFRTDFNRESLEHAGVEIYSTAQKKSFDQKLA